MRPTVILTLRADNGAAVEVDLYENESISYSSNFNSVSEFTTRGPFSREFRIPATGNNISFFGPQFDANLLNNDGTQINTLRKIDATLTVDTLPIAEGYVQFKRSITQMGKMHEFEIAFFGEIVDVFKSIGDKLIRDLDYTDLDHTNDYATINDINSGGGVYGTNICYTLTDKGQSWSEESTANSRRIFSNVNPIYTSELTLAVNAYWLLNKIITEAGFVWLNQASITIADQLASIYMPYVTNPLILGTVTNEEAKFIAAFPGATTSVTIDTAAANGQTKKQLTAWTESFDPSNSFASDVYTSQGNLSATFYINANFIIPGAVAFAQNAYDFVISVTRGGIETLYQMSGGSAISDTVIEYDFTTGQYIQAPVDPIVYAQYTVDMQVGDEIRYFVFAHAGSSQSILFGANCTIGVSYVTGELQAQPISFFKNAPEYKQADMLRDILKLYNGALVIDPNYPNGLELIPMNEYLGTGDVYDWTGKLDLSKDIVLTPPSDIRKKLLRWSYKEQGDYFNAQYKNGAQRVYGELRLTDPGNDFSTSDYLNELVLGASPCDLIPNTTYIIPKYFNDNLEFNAPGPRILYRRKSSGDAVVMVYDEYNEVSTFTQLPLLSHYSGIPTDIQTRDLNFGQEIPPHPIDYMPLNTQWHLYWRQYIAELYDSEQKVMEAYFKLGLTDVFGIQFNDKIWIKDSMWRLIELTDYIIGGEQIVKCKLLRLLDIAPLCKFTPYQINATNGAVTFINAAGDESFGSETCCNFYGYNWDNSKGHCFASTGTNGTGGIISSPNIVGGSNITNTSGNQKSVTGMGNVNRASIENNNERILVSGLGHGISPNNNYSQALGYRNFIRPDLEGTTVMGKWAEADIRGVHYGGGTWWDITSDFGGTLPGRSQHGFIQLMGLASIVTQPTNIPLYVDGVDGATINMPTESIWHIKVYISVMEYDYNVSDYTNRVAMVEYSSMIWKDKTTHYSSTPYKVHQDNNGFAANRFNLTMPIVSGQIAPNIVCTSTGKTAVISATIQYTQTKFQRIPII